MHKIVQYSSRKTVKITWCNSNCDRTKYGYTNTIIYSNSIYYYTRSRIVSIAMVVSIVHLLYFLLTIILHHWFDFFSSLTRTGRIWIDLDAIFFFSCCCCCWYCCYCFFVVIFFLSVLWFSYGMRQPSTRIVAKNVLKWLIILIYIILSSCSLVWAMLLLHLPKNNYLFVDVLCSNAYLRSIWKKNYYHTDFNQLYADSLQG